MASKPMPCAPKIAPASAESTAALGQPVASACDSASGVASVYSYAPIRDVAAKAAENIARLAALFHMLDHGATGTIDRACVDSATEIVRWHLQEAHRLLGELDAPPVMAAAIRLDAWLRDEALRTGDGRIPTTQVYRYGPGCVRNSKDLKDAVALLAEHGRVRLEEDGRRRIVVVNPALSAG